MKQLLVILFFVPLCISGDDPDTTKVKPAKRSYAPIQEKMQEQNRLLDSIILKLRADTIKIK